jgi:hypothetical protein
MPKIVSALGQPEEEAVEMVPLFIRWVAGTMFIVAAFAPKLATADEAISGQWRADQGHNVLIVMDVLADGHWASQTVQDDKVVAELAGSYQQTPKNATTGMIVWTPVKAKTTQEHGAATVETDDYTLENGGETLKLVTQKTKEEMVFQNHMAQQ